MQIPFTKQVLKQQLKMFRRVACAQEGDVLRKLTFCPGSLRPATDRYVRRVGRPRHEWATKLHQEALRVASQHPAKMLEDLLLSKIDDDDGDNERRANIFKHSNRS